VPEAVFGPASHYAPTDERYELLPFRFMDFDGGKIVVNEVGEHELLDPPDFEALVDHRLGSDTRAYRNLKAKHFLRDSPSDLPLMLLATKYRTKRSFLQGFTRLHIFVVTLRCDHSCHYCQVSRVSMNREKYDMTRESADRALDLTFRSPAMDIKIEFQGGEPLLNFDLIQYITEGAKQRNKVAGKNLQFVVATNLSFLNEEILAYLKEQRIWVSTSLDGPAFIHNANRPRPGNDAYETTIRGINRVRQVLGGDAVSALMTTTKLSLQHPDAIVDEYVRQGFDRVFLRPLSPYGFAVKTQARTGYELDAFLSFYKRALDHVIELNRQGRWMVEIYAQLLLTKILTPFATGYDGDVYATDEARMLAQMGDTTFRLGNVHTDSYEAIFGGELLRSLVAASCVESLPGCADCAYQTFCGADPVENYATQGDIFGHRPTSRFCGRNMEIIRHLLRLYHGDDPFVRELFWAWVHNTPPDVLLPELPA